LLGVGWWQYQQPANHRSRLFQRRVLHHDLPHSLRDGYSADQLRASGFDNVLNTSCVTLWDLDKAAQASIPTGRAGSVITTLTDYKPAPALDRAMLELLQRRYDEVSIWIQGAGDYAYIESLGVSGVRIIDPQLEAFDEALTAAGELDYIGTRLHAGVRAMYRGRRAMILGVDNRATEIARDVQLPVIERANAVEELDDWIDGNSATRLTIPWNAITAWKDAIRGHLGLPETVPIKPQVT
jgi:polysaccharide pyruvyl transferase WcaK-like protein